MPDKPSIAVLPFTNLSGDPEQEYFSDGITEDIITELSRFRSLFAIARNSSFQFRGKAVDVRQVARELGVQYVAEGGIRKLGDRLRFTAQLIDASTGSHLWSERYDRDLKDIFAVQDEVTRSIVGALMVGLEDEALERAKRKRPESLQAYEHWLHGKRLSETTGLKYSEARAYFERAIAIDPAYSAACAGLSMTYSMEANQFPLPVDFTSGNDKAFKWAQRALALDGADDQGHVAITWAYLYRGEYDQAKKHLERAIKLNPNNSVTLASAAIIFAYLGEPDEGVKCGEAALRLNPRHPDWYLGYLSIALLFARRHRESAAIRLQVPDAHIDSSFFGAALLAHIGMLDQAKQWAERGLARLATTAGGAKAIAEGQVVQVLLVNNPFRRQEDRDHFADGMRKAGIPG